MTDDLNNAINLVYERTGMVPEVETATELAEVLLEMGEAISVQHEMASKPVTLGCRDGRIRLMCHHEYDVGLVLGQRQGRCSEWRYQH